MPPHLMQAARIHAPGPPDAIVVECVDVPEPGSEEVLVHVSAAGVGPWDALVRNGYSGLPQTYPLILGSEISGVVAKVGLDVADFVVGDEVFGATNPLFINGYAEYALAAARMLTLKPVGLSHVEAAALPVVGVTAWQMLFDHGAAREGQTVLVHGAAGNVGSYVVQLAHAHNLHVIGTVFGSDPGYVLGLGADQVIDTKAQNLMELGTIADILIDTVGGKGQEQLFAVIKSDGVIVSSVVRPDTQLAARHRVRADYFIVDVKGETLALLAQMKESERLTIPVGAVLPLVDATGAHEMLAGARAHKRGKVVLAVNP